MQILLVFEKNGIRKAKHTESRCNFRNQDISCRAGFYFGYTTYQGMRIFDDDVLKNNSLVVSNQSAFDIDYLVELVSDVELYAADFDTCAKKFNRYHILNLPSDNLNKHVMLYKKTVANAYSLFTYLEICQPYKIKNYQIIQTTLDSAILEHKEALSLEFCKRWTVDHKCNKKGCQNVLVIDAGLKPFRFCS